MVPDPEVSHSRGRYIDRRGRHPPSLMRHGLLTLVRAPSGAVPAPAPSSAPPTLEASRTSLLSGHDHDRDAHVNAAAPPESMFAGHIEWVTCAEAAGRSLQWPKCEHRRVSDRTLAFPSFEY